MVQTCLYKLRFRSVEAVDCSWCDVLCHLLLEEHVIVKSPSEIADVTPLAVGTVS